MKLHRPHPLSTLDYGRPEGRRPWWTGLAWACFAVSPVMVILLAISLPVREVEDRMDAVTGSSIRRTTWLFGLATTTAATPSPLEERLKAKRVNWRPDWVFLHRSPRNIFNRPLRRACGYTPPIYHLQRGLDEFVDRSTDEELVEFILIMQTGSEQEQRVAVKAAFETTLADALPVTADAHTRSIDPRRGGSSRQHIRAPSLVASGSASGFEGLGEAD